MSESRNPVSNRLDAESGESVKSRVSRGRRLLEALFPRCKQRRLLNEAKDEQQWQELVALWRADDEREAREAEKDAKAERIKEMREEARNRGNSARTYQRLRRVRA